ncbi:LPXTG cell wall anchor domain-containing protein [Winogradskyella sp. R77965]|uniref:LPXTG cell wall anchor domain-containing protein n=1 Tax=Winogradskyella sp. R77965 TaxID=3093872 RepID=UPI0037DD99B0
MKTILALLLFVFSQIGFAQLIDPFGKVVTHEIKLKKLDNGTYAGAIEWTTGGVDSLQRYIIQGLDVKAPVMVRIISKAPDHNIDLSFHKKNWDKIESKVSTDGNKFVDKIFRTMNIAGLGVRSEVAGIPYLITVKVGLQLPATKSLIRITDDKEEYTKHLRKMGFGGAVFEDDNSSNSNNSGLASKNSGDNNNLMYIIIGLLAAVVILLAIFLMKRKKPKHTVILLFAFCLAQFCMAQSRQPKLVPIDGQGASPVFFEYQTSNVGNQVPIETVMNTGVADMVVAGDTSLETVFVRLDTAPGVEELTGKDAAEVLRRIKEANERFDSDYGENSPGNKTEGDQRTLPTDRTNAELNRLRRQVQQLQQQVDLLSEEDEEYDEDFDDGGGEILLYCEELQACQNCIQRGFDKFNTHRAYFNFLQKYYLKKVTDLNDWIEYGNAMSSIPGGGGMAWGPILLHKVKPAMEQLKAAYNKKFDEYIASMEVDLEEVSACFGGVNGRFRSRDGYEFQMFAVLTALKASRIHK